MKIARLKKEIVEGKGYVILPDLISLEEAAEARDLILKFAQHLFQ